MNLGNPEEYTVLELARLIRHLTGSSSSIVLSPYPRITPNSGGRISPWRSGLWDGNRQYRCVMGYSTRLPTTGTITDACPRHRRGGLHWQPYGEGPRPLVTSR